MISSPARFGAHQAVGSAEAKEPQSRPAAVLF